MMILRVVVATVLAGSLAWAEDTLFFRVRSSSTTIMTSATTDGVLVWSNAAVGTLEQLQRATTLAPADWQDYVLVPATGTTSAIKAYEFHPPPGMTLIPAGSFVMGAPTNVLSADAPGPNELPQHTVFISAFYMDIHEVTKTLWDQVRLFNGGNGYTYSNDGSGWDTNHPVHTINWFDAVKWCNARSERDGLTPAYYADAGFTTLFKTGEAAPFANWNVNGYRLPTEAEWEKAARGGTANTRYPWTDYTNKISWAKANYRGMSDTFSYDLSGGPGAYHPQYETTNGFPYSSPVGAFAPNGYGLYDMAGNMTEWCWDWEGDNYYAASPGADPRGPDQPSNVLFLRIVRGGSWVSSARFARNSMRYGTNHDTEGSSIGFRCVRGL